LEWIEPALRQALDSLGCRILEELFNDSRLVVAGNQPRPGEKSHSDRSQTVHTLFGPIVLRRTYYYHPATGTGRFPLDEALGLVEDLTPGLGRAVCRAVAQGPFTAAQEDLKEYLNVHLDSRKIQRFIDRIAPQVRAALDKQVSANPSPGVPVMYIAADGTGCPMKQAELKGRRGKQPDGSAKTREIKAGCVFTQHGTDAKGWPLRDPDSTSYVASFDTAENFGHFLGREACRRGVAAARQVVFLGDGAHWVWELVRLQFPNAIPILDFYHAAQHARQLADALYGPGSQKAKDQTQHWIDLFKKDQIARVIPQAQADALSLKEPDAQTAQNHITYFKNNQHRMLYQTYRQNGWFIGSGVVEAACKTVIGGRLKQSGMFWTVPGATNVLTLRTALKSNRLNSFWQQRSSPPASPPSIALAA